MSKFGLGKMDGDLTNVGLGSLSWIGFFFYGLLNKGTASATQMHENRLKWKAGGVLLLCASPFLSTLMDLLSTVADLLLTFDDLLST